MAIPRQSLPDFAVGNEVYAGAQVAIHAVDASFVKTATLAPVYAGVSGSTALANPQTLDSRGKWPQPVYVGQPVVMVVTGGPLNFVNLPAEES